MNEREMMQQRARAQAAATQQKHGTQAQLQPLVENSQRTEKTPEQQSAQSQTLQNAMAQIQESSNERASERLNLVIQQMQKMQEQQSQELLRTFQTSLQNLLDQMVPAVKTLNALSTEIQRGNQSFARSGLTLSSCLEEKLEVLNSQLGKHVQILTGRIDGIDKATSTLARNQQMTHDQMIIHEKSRSAAHSANEARLSHLLPTGDLSLETWVHLAVMIAVLFGIGSFVTILWTGMRLRALQPNPQEVNKALGYQRRALQMDEIEREINALPKKQQSEIWKMLGYDLDVSAKQ